jgi:hypothetical protein
MAAFSSEELSQRVAALRRFRELLVQQRAKFEGYLKVLDFERADIESGDVDKLSAHVEIEESIVSEIFTFQKVIDPLERMYKSAYPAAEAGDLPELRSALDALKDEVLRRNAENRALLKRRMELVRAEIAGFRNPLASRASVYARQGGGALVDISG